MVAGVATVVMRAAATARVGAPLAANVVVVAARAKAEAARARAAALVVAV